MFYRSVADAVILPSVPFHKGTPNLVHPEVKEASKSFNMFRSWGNLSPWYSVPRGTFGLDSGPEVPESCRITEAHILHRHGARCVPTFILPYFVLTSLI